MGSSESLAKALAMRRGKGLDPSMMRGGDELSGITSAMEQQAEKPGPDEPNPNLKPPVGATASGSEHSHDDQHMKVMNEIRDHVSDNGSEEDYDSNKDMKPRSLGERAKMMALKEKYGK
jgi:hypothetical protein